MFIVAINHVMRLQNEDKCSYKSRNALSLYYSNFKSSLKGTVGFIFSCYFFYSGLILCSDLTLHEFFYSCFENINVSQDTHSLRYLVCLINNGYTGSSFTPEVLHVIH